MFIIVLGEVLDRKGFSGYIYMNTKTRGGGALVLPIICLQQKIKLFC